MPQQPPATPSRSEQRIESVVSMPILNPDTGAASRTFEFAGVEDVYHGDEIADYKGVASTERWIREQKIGFQAECYALCHNYVGETVRRIVYRLVTRPMLKYSHPSYKWAVRKAGRKTAVKVCDNQEEAMKLAALQGGSVEERITGDASRDAFEQRCLEQMFDEPTRVVEHVYHLTETRMQRAAEWLWQNCKRLLECWAHDRWLQNEKSCYAYSRECPYMALCEGIVDGVDVEWLKGEEYEESDPHPELNGYRPTKLPTKRNHRGARQGVVTYSSLTTLAMCEVRYYWRYVARLKRRQHEDGEALWLGSAMHRGLQVYAEGGLDAGLAAVDEWARDNPVLGENAAWLLDQQIARARAMVRAAALRWPIEVSYGD
jgi:hypothetical protein